MSPNKRRLALKAEHFEANIRSHHLPTTGGHGAVRSGRSAHPPASRCLNPEYNQALSWRFQLSHLKLTLLKICLTGLHRRSVSSQSQPKPNRRRPSASPSSASNTATSAASSADSSQHPEVQLVAIVEPDAALAAKYEQQYKLDHALFYKDVDSMVPATKPQALLVYTSIAGHRQAIEAGARHHLPVMVEKPLTMSLADALAIRETARKANIQVLVNYETTWYSSNLAAYNAIEQGKLGDLRKVVIHDGHEGPQEIHVQPEFLKWLNDPTKNGDGALYDFGCYGADLMTWLMHGQAPISVTAVGQIDKPSIYNVFDDATIILRYPKAQAVLMPSWNWPFSRKDSEIYGATGYMITVGPSHYRLRLAGETDETTATAPPISPPNDNSMDYLCGRRERPAHT